MDTYNFYNPFLRDEKSSLIEKINRLERQVRTLSEKLFNKENNKPYLTREETAKMCGVRSLTTLHNWKIKGILVPTGKAGRKPLYKRQDVVDYIEKKGGCDEN